MWLSWEVVAEEEVFIKEILHAFWERRIFIKKHFKSEAARVSCQSRRARKAAPSPNKPTGFINLLILILRNLPIHRENSRAPLTPHDT